MRANRLLLVFLLCTLAAPFEALAKVAEIVTLAGQGQSKAANAGDWRDAKARQELDDGDFVRTGKQSTMGLLFADQTQIRLSADTTMQVRAPAAAQGPSVSLRKGRSWMQSKNPPQGLTVATPSAIAAIHGTDWEIEVDEAGNATLTVLSGEVRFYNDQGTVTVNRNEQAYAMPGKAPLKRSVVNPRERVQWVSAYAIDAARYPELSAAANPDTAQLAQIATLLREGRMGALEEALAPFAVRRLAVAELLLAELRILHGDYAGAEERLNAGGQQHPADERFPVLLARLALMRGDAAAAKIHAGKALAVKPNSPEALLAGGEIARFEGQAKQALRAFDAVSRENPQDARARHGVGVVESERENIAAARESLTQALQLAPDGPGYAGDLATLEIQANDFAAARSRFDEAASRHPDDYVALTGLGLLELKSGNTDAAREALLKASLIEPKYARAHIYLAVAHYQQGQVGPALFELGRAGELDPNDPLPHQMASMIHGDRSDPGKAVDEARIALKKLPNLKSLNQIANNQQGTANLGSALALLGLEGWAQSYAMQSYDPLWAGSHFFLAERLTGQYSRNSELLQGYLTDPTAIGASNRFQTLLSRPGQYADLSLRATRSDDFRSREPGIVANGTTLAPGFPVAYFFEGLRLDGTHGNVPLDASANTYTAALGLAPRHDWNVFLFANGTQPDVFDKINPSRETHTSGTANRVEAGLTYRPRARESWWLKTGLTDYDANVDVRDLNGGAWRPYTSAQTTIQRRDLQLRHTFDLENGVELAWGAEKATAAKPVDTRLLIPKVTRQVKDDDESATLYASVTHRPVSGLLLQADLGWQEYDKAQSTAFSPRVATASGFDFHRRDLNPRLGLAWQPDPGKVVRLAWQKWRRPASYTTLSPLATAGIVLDDQTVLSGGELTRLRGQVEWEADAATFYSAFVDYKEIANLGYPGSPLNTGEDIADLNRLRSRDVLLNLANPEILEAAPAFYQGRILTTGIAASRRITARLAGYANYLHTQSENTSTWFPDAKLPYLPRHRAGAGITWSGENRLSLGSHLVYRSLRYVDEAHSGSLTSGWDLTLKAGWHSADKRWQVDAYAANLLKRDSSDVVGVNVAWRF